MITGHYPIGALQWLITVSCPGAVAWLPAPCVWLRAPLDGCVESVLLSYQGGLCGNLPGASLNTMELVACGVVTHASGCPRRGQYSRNGESIQSPPPRHAGQ